MYEYKLSTARWAPVRIKDGTGNPVTGVLFSAVTASVQKADGSVATFTVTGSDWIEATTGAFASQGVYAVQFPASVLNQAGMLSYAVASTGNVTYIGSVKVVANEEVDTFTKVALLQKYEEGRWKIHTSGVDANRLVLYDTDGITPIKKFDLKDAASDPSYINPFERVPV